MEQKGDEWLSYNRGMRKNGHHTDSSTGSTFHYLARMKQGKSRFVGEGFDLEFNEGEMYFIPKGFKYHSYWYGVSNVIWDVIAFRWLPGDTVYIPQKLNDKNSIAFDKFIDEFIETDCESVSQFFHLFGMITLDMKKDGRNTLDKRASAALRIMLSDPLVTVGEAAKRAGISESGLYSEFRKTGTTPVKARLTAQIKKATELLTTTDMTVEAISEQIGFSSTSYFYQTFRKLTGKTTRYIRSSGMM